MSVNNKFRKRGRILKKLLLLIFVCLLIFIAFNFSNIRDKILESLYPKEYSEYVEVYAKKYDLDEELVYAIIKAESNFESNAVSSKGACGLMQLMYPTAEDIAKKMDIKIDEKRIMDPEININLGTNYISMLIDRYGNIGVALAAYNAGSGNVDSWIDDGTIKSDGSDIEKIPFKETNNYVRKILRDYNIYQELYG